MRNASPCPSGLVLVLQTPSVGTRPPWWGCPTSLCLVSLSPAPPAPWAVEDRPDWSQRCSQGIPPYIMSFPSRDLWPGCPAPGGSPAMQDHPPVRRDMHARDSTSSPCYVWSRLQGCVIHARGPLWPSSLPTPRSKLILSYTSGLVLVLVLALANGLRQLFYIVTNVPPMCS